MIVPHPCSAHDVFALPCHFSTPRLSDASLDRLAARHSVLFLGTEKYPEEGDFENYLTQHGGSSNAVRAFIHFC